MAPETARYSGVAIVLHWAVAALILANLCLALVFEILGTGLPAFRLIQLHKSVGLSVLALMCVRLAWRLSRRPPPLAAPFWRKRAAGLVHGLLYAAAIALPLTGWIMVSASPLNLPTLYFGLFAVPHIAPVHALDPAARRSLGAVAGGAHLTLALVLCALVGGHVAAVFGHQFLERNDVLGRMLPWARRRSVQAPDAA